MIFSRYDDEYANDFDKLESLFNNSANADPVKPMNKIMAFLGFLLLPVIAGGLIGIASLPLIFPVGAASNATLDYWDGLATELPDIPPPQRSVIVDVHDQVIAEVYSQNRIITSLDEVSPFVIQALISTEDRAFYEHSGYSARGMIRALANNASGESMQGASTITQQLVKNTLVVNAETSDDREAATASSIFRKFEELKYALALEEKFTKDEILERYLNLVLYSNGVYGIGTAASYYYGVPASDLTVAQSAMLIGLLKNPSGYDPINNPERAVARRNIVINNMLATESIDAATAELAKLEPLGLNIQKPVNGCSTAPDPFYCQTVMDRITNSPILGDTPEERQAKLYQGGLTIHTYFDVEVFNKIQAGVDSALGRENRVASGVAVVQPGTGIVPAIAQNRTWGDGVEGSHEFTQVIYPDRVTFQAGSAFKVFTLAAALEAGIPLDTVIDAPAVYDPAYMNTPAGGITNISRSGTGVMDMVTATARSSNTFYTILQERIGVMTVADMAENLGMTVPRTGDVAVGAKDSSFTLGTTSVSPLQMAAAYATFAAGGKYCEPRFVEEVFDVYGTPIGQHLENCYQAVSPQTASKVTVALQAVVDGPDEGRTAPAASLGDRPVAGKTGTTNQQAAVWFVGYTPEYSVATWVGDPRGGQKYPLSQGFRFQGSWVTNAYSGVVSAPLWHDVMQNLVAGTPVTQFSTPQAVSSSGNIIPTVVGMNTEDAINLLESRGYVVKVSTQNAPANEFYQPNQVISQTPVGGTQTLLRKTTITLTLSEGSTGFDYYY